MSDSAANIYIEI